MRTGVLLAASGRPSTSPRKVVIRRRRKRVLQPGSRVDFNQVVFSRLRVAQDFDFADPEVVQAFDCGSGQLLNTIVYAHLDAGAGLTQLCRGPDLARGKEQRVTSSSRKRHRVLLERSTQQ